MAARAQVGKTLWIKFSKSSKRLPVKKESLKLETDAQKERTCKLLSWYLQLGIIRKDHESDQLRTLQKWLPAKACDKSCGSNFSSFFWAADAKISMSSGCIKFNLAKAQAMLLMSRDPCSSVRSQACMAIANIKASLKQQRTKRVGQGLWLET